MIAILSDIHANLPALEAVLSDMPKVSAVWVIGDMVGEMPWPCQVLDLLMNMSCKVHMICGNREQTLMELRRGEHRDWWHGTQLRSFAWTSDQLKEHHWRMIDALQPTLSITDRAVGGGLVDNAPLATDAAQGAQAEQDIATDATTGTPDAALLFHGTPDKVRGKIHTFEEARAAAALIPHRTLVCGHTHHARLFRVGSQTVINASSVGLPLDGVGGVASYALLDETRAPDDARRVTLRQVAYDVDAAARDMRDSELYELAPGVSRAVISEMLTGRHYLMALVMFAQEYARRELGREVGEIPPELWREAERAWDGAEWLPGRTQ